MLIILSVISFYLALDQRELKNGLPVVSSIVQVLGILMIVASILVEIIVLVPNIIINLYFLIKSIFSKESKIRANGVMKSLVIYDWVLEKAYIRDKKIKAKRLELIRKIKLHSPKSPYE